MSRPSDVASVAVGARIKVSQIFLKWFTQVEKVLNLLSAAMIMVMVLLITADVLKRWLLGGSIKGAYETTEFLLVGVIFFSMAYTQARKGHIRIDMIFTRFPTGLRRWASVIYFTIGLAVFIFITWRGAQLAFDSWQVHDVTEGYPGLPRWPARMAIPVGGFVLCCRLILDIFGLMLGSSSSKTNEIVGGGSQ